jgi:hypothetical protein
MSSPDAKEHASLIERAAARVDQQLSAELPTAVAEEPSSGPWYEAAAVLGTFIPDVLDVLTDGAAEPDGLDALLAHSMHTVQPNGEPGWTLSAGARVATLRRLRERGRSRKAIDRNPAREDDLLGIALQRYIMGTAAPITSQATLDEVTASRQACDWLRSAGFEGLPQPAELRQRVDWLSLLEPFQHLAGPFFRGREDELQTLRRYAGVQPPGSLTESGRRLVERVFSLTDKPPLLVSGPGGVGKSTLMARFILEHAQALEVDRFPFAYLDVERADVDAGEPLTLLAEAVRQLGIAYPHAYDSAQEIRNDWLELLRQGKPGLRSRAGALRDLGIFIERLGAADRPVLLIIDTFEVVQFRSQEAVDEIWRLLQDLQREVTRLRVCIVGRAPIANHTTQELRLNELDREAAVGYLQARGIVDRELARRLARQAGGSPLSLKLVADLAAREHGEGAVQDLDTRGFLGLRAKQEVIQRQLYTRILGHIHDPDVRRLAHPGLVLRRLTPELICDVLAEPCGLKIQSFSEAQTLFDSLAREVSLVSTSSDGALVHRPDLRRLMLDLLVADEPEKARRIHALAVAYYEQRPLVPEERAEEIYHRLALGQSAEQIDPRWVPGVEPSIETAIPEFGGARRAYLAARLGFAVDDETREAAALEDWERITAPRARRLLADGKAKAALKLMGERVQRSLASPLPVLEATALAHLDQWAESASLLEDEIDRVTENGLREPALALTLTYAELALLGRRTESAQRIAYRLDDLDRTTTRAQDRLAVLARWLKVERISKSQPSEERLGQLRASFDEVTDEVLIASPRLARWAAWSFTVEDVERFGRVLSLVQLPRGDESSVRSLAAALAAFDQSYSAQRGREPGELAAQAGVTVATSLTASWGQFLLEASEAVISDAIRALLAAHRDVIPSTVTAALAEVMGSGLVVRLEPESDVVNVTLGASRARPSVPTTVRRDLEEALLAAFATADELRALLRHRLDISVDAIAPASETFRMMVAQTVAYADERGFLPELVAAAREVYPRDERLLRVSGDLGVSTIIPSDLGAIQRLAGASRSIDLPNYTIGLADIENQVCLVDVATQAFATGFLVGVDLVLTAEFALTPVFNAGLPPEEVRLRFDYKATADGKVLTPGTEFRVSEIVAHRPYGERANRPGYALLRVDGAPGGQPVGGPRTESHGDLRRWINIPVTPPSLEIGDPLAIVQHPQGEPLQMSFGANAVAGFSTDGARMYHMLATLPGSAGSPCFNLQLEPVAFHIGTSGADRQALSGAGVAVLLSAVMDDLREQGLDDMLTTPFA